MLAKHSRVAALTVACSAEFRSDSDSDSSSESACLMSNLNLAAIFTTVAKSPSTENATAFEVEVDAVGGECWVSAE